MPNLLRGLGHLLAPRICRVCHQTLAEGEDTICVGCMLDLPRTEVHTRDFNEIHQRLGHHSCVDRAAGWFYYRRQSPYAKLLVDAKYGHLPRLARNLGAMCAEELLPSGFFAGIGALVPMPIHWTKRLQRGYNQAEEICIGISQATGVPVVRALEAMRSHGIQSRNTRQQRYSSISHTLRARHGCDLSAHHTLLVDDIITTGATVTEAIRALAEASPAAISVLCLGLTKED